MASSRGEDDTRPLDFDTRSLKTLIGIYQDFIVKNMKVDGLFLSPMMMAIPVSMRSQIMSLATQTSSVLAAQTLLDALLKSEDEATWSSFREHLLQPEHRLIRDILEKGQTDDLLLHHQRQNLVVIFMRLFVEKMDAMEICELLLQENLLTQMEAEKVRACYRNEGESFANLLIMSCVPKSKDWYPTFMKILYNSGQKELVQTVDSIIAEKIEAAQSDSKDMCGQDGTMSQCLEDVVYDSGGAEASAKLYAAEDEHLGQPSGSLGALSRKKRWAGGDANLASGFQSKKTLLKDDKQINIDFLAGMTDLIPNIRDAISAMSPEVLTNIIGGSRSHNPPGVYSLDNGTNKPKTGRPPNKLIEKQTSAEENLSSIESVTENSVPRDEELSPEVIEMLMSLPDEDVPPDEWNQLGSSQQEIAETSSRSLGAEASSKRSKKEKTAEKDKRPERELETPETSSDEDEDSFKYQSKMFAKGAENQTHKLLSRARDMVGLYFGTYTVMADKMVDIVEKWQNTEDE